MPDRRATSRARTRALLPVLVALPIWCAGCSGGSSDAEPDPAPTSESGSPSASDPSSPEAAATFGFQGLKPGRPKGGFGRSTLPCDGERRLITFSQLTVDREVELRSVGPVGAHVTTRRAWMTDLSDQVSSEGLTAPGLPGPTQTQEPGWPVREPLKGYVMEPGTVYTYFVEFLLGRKGDQEGFTLTYAVDGEKAEVEIPNRVSRRPC